MIECLRCKGDLGHSVDDSNDYTKYCYKCKQCAECLNVMGVADLEFNIKYNPGADQPWLHCLCLAPGVHDSIVNRKVEVSQRELDALNAAHLMIKPTLELNHESNAKEAELLAFKYFQDLPTMEEKFLVLRRMEAITAAFSVLFKRDPASKKVKADLNEKERAKWVAATSKQDLTYVKCSKCNGRFSELEVDKHFKTCEGKPAVAPKVKSASDKIKYTPFEKTVRTLIQFSGCSVESGIEQASSMFMATGQQVGDYSVDRIRA